MDGEITQAHPRPDGILWLMNGDQDVISFNVKPEIMQKYLNCSETYDVGDGVYKTHSEWVFMHVALDQGKDLGYL